MSAAIHCVDVVRKRVDFFVVAVVVLDGYLDGKRIPDFFEVDRFVMQDVLVLIQMLDELRDAATIIKFVRLLRLFTLVLDRDPNSFVQKSFLAQSLRQFVETELDSVKNLWVRLEGNLGSALACLAGLFQLNN